MNHTPTLDRDLYTCPACAWRAVLTSDARIVQTQPGDPGHDHIGQARAQQAERLTEARRILARLRAQYDTHATFSDQSLSLRQLQRLTQAVVGEFV